MADQDISDLVGDIGGGGDTNGESPDQNQGALGAVNSGITQAGDKKKEDEKALETERQMVAKTFEEYTTARDFDKQARIGFAMDRKYAAGLSDPAWASDANLIGSFIDILTSFLYAQNPDVACKPAAQVGQVENKDNEDLADTLEIVISKLWRLAQLKKTVRRQVRATLSVGQGWMKALIWSQKRPQPQVEKTLHDQEAAMARVTALVTEIREKGDDAGVEAQAVQQAQLALNIAGLRAKIELAKEYGLNVDYVRSEDMQVSLDVSTITDYLSADWCSEDMYIPQTALKIRFPRLTDEDVAQAALYYQKSPTTEARGDVMTQSTGEGSQSGTFSKEAPSAGNGSGKPVQFAKIVEFWDKRDSNIKTMCDGIKRWCVEPYPTPQASTRFYPYFMLEFFPVDGMRHPQSLSWRLRKLQDEYSACRSNQRLTRERSIPGLIFNKGALSPEDAKALANSTIAESVGIQPTDINMPLQNVVMAKPQVPIDTRLWDASSIRADMESISGVQEALQQTAKSSQPKTATEAQIEQTGFASRSSADRDVLEDELNSLAHYTAECALQEIPANEASRIAGPKAFWPEGMDVQDLLTLVEVDIEAGTTGKPDAAADKANWATILPLLQKLMVQVRQLQSTDPDLGNSMTNLLRETLKRMDDRLDISEFVTQSPPPPPPPAPKPLPNISVALKGVLPALDAAAIGAQAAGLPPEAMLAGGGAGGPPAVLPGAPDHPGAHIADGEIPLHPHMPVPLPAAQKTPAQGGDTQKPHA